jgi:hypothetical protein
MLTAKGGPLAYRVNTQFKDGSRSGPLADVVAAPPPRCGDTVFVSQQGRSVSVRVTAVWTPSVKFQGRAAHKLIMVEAREI